MDIGYFILRPGAPYIGLQLVKFHGDIARPGKLSSNDIAISWKLCELDIHNTEKQIIRQMNGFKTGVGVDWIYRISKYWLQCNESPNLRFRILYLNPISDLRVTLPARKDTIVIPLKDIQHLHSISPEDRTRILEIYKQPNTVQWFQEGMAALLAPAFPAAHATHPRPLALSSYIANTLVQHARAQPDAVCPITHEPLTESTKFSVGNCGHVYSAIAATMCPQSCPMCSQPVTWTTVEIPT